MSEKEMKKFADRCLIYFVKDGKKRAWAISAHPEKDNDETLKHHLESILPGAIYLGHKFSPDEPGTFPEKWADQKC